MENIHIVDQADGLEPTLSVSFSLAEASTLLASLHLLLHTAQEALQTNDTVPPEDIQYIINMSVLLGELCAATDIHTSHIITLADETEEINDLIANMDA